MRTFVYSANVLIKEFVNLITSEGKTFLEIEYDAVKRPIQIEWCVRSDVSLVPCLSLVCTFLSYWELTAF